MLSGVLSSVASLQQVSAASSECSRQVRDEERLNASPLNRKINQIFRNIQNNTYQDIRSEAPDPAQEAQDEPLRVIRISPELEGSILTSGSPTTRLRPVGPDIVGA